MRNHVIIAHGMSELDLFRGILAWTGQDAVIYSRNNGRNNIAISHLDRILREAPFTSEKALHDSYPELRYNSRCRQKMPDLRIFPIMDYDGDNVNVLPYITGNYPEGVPLREFVTPVLNYPNMEATMDAIGYDVKGIDKGDFYKNLVRGLRRRDDILGFYGRLRDCDCTNMEVVLFHMLERHPDYQDVLEPPRAKNWAMLRNL